MTDSSGEQLKKLTTAQELFKNAQPEYQSLIRDVLKEEREVMHLSYRNDIHQKIYEHVKRVIR